jgi:hypothetical protein
LTRELVGQAVDVEAVEPLEVKGKSRALDAYRLVGVLPDVEPYRREGDAPLVGRERELELLGGALREAREAGRCVACTVVGPPGVGKSRLVREFVTGVDDGWRVLVGRCPSYGEGVTFVPLAEAIEPVLADIAHDGLGAEQVEIALGLRTGSMSPEEAFSVLRTFLERLAASAPVVLVVDDLHWAEPRLLDFLEHLTAFSAEAPILLVCISRPELVDERPSWSAPRDNVRFVSVAPLADDESTELVTHLLSSRGLESAELTRVLEAADGNPLFLEQLLALNAELDADEPLLVPPTIAALLAARLDQLADNERAFSRPQRSRAACSNAHTSSSSSTAKPKRTSVPSWSRSRGGSSSVRHEGDVSVRKHSLSPTGSSATRPTRRCRRSVEHACTSSWPAFARARVHTTRSSAYTSPMRLGSGRSSAIWTTRRTSSAGEPLAISGPEAKGHWRWGTTEPPRSCSSAPSSSSASTTRMGGWRSSNWGGRSPAAAGSSAPSPASGGRVLCQGVRRPGARAPGRSRSLEPPGADRRDDLDG